MGATTDNLNIAAITVTSGVDRQQALAAGASFASTGTASVSIPAGQCSSIRFLCIVLAIPATAKYADAGPSNNAKCEGISARISCSPGK